MEAPNVTPGQVKASSPGHTNKDDTTPSSSNTSGASVPTPGSTGSNEHQPALPDAPYLFPPPTANPSFAQVAAQPAPPASTARTASEAADRWHVAQAYYHHPHQHQHQRGCVLCDTVNDLFSSAGSQRAVDLLFAMACHELDSFPVDSPCIVEDKAFFVSAFLSLPTAGLDHAVADEARMLWLRALQYKGVACRGKLEAIFHHPGLASKPWPVPTATTTAAYLRSNLPADSQVAENREQAEVQGPALA